jgi:hypothetical protein
MNLISTVMSGLALLAAVISLVVSIREKKRNQKRNVALCDLRDKDLEAIKAAFEEIRGKITDLESGVIPDHEAAKRAADSLNDFNRGIASIMGFDPFEAIRAEREKNQEKEGAE